MLKLMDKYEISEKEIEMFRKYREEEMTDEECIEYIETILDWIVCPEAILEDLKPIQNKKKILKNIAKMSYNEMMRTLKSEREKQENEWINLHKKEIRRLKAGLNLIEDKKDLEIMKRLLLYNNGSSDKKGLALKLGISYKELLYKYRRLCIIVGVNSNTKGLCDLTMNDHIIFLDDYMSPQDIYIVSILNEDMSNLIELSEELGQEPNIIIAKYNKAERRARKRIK